MTPSDENLRRTLLTAAFQMPAVASMLSRTSSITNAFVCTLIPQIKPSTDEIEKALAILGMDASDMRCAYCGDKMTEWDHLRPLVVKQRPSGYISEIANLVPACGKCNQSKGNSNWRDWMVNKKAKHSPTARGKQDVAQRIARLDEYTRLLEPTKINAADFEAIVGKAEWEAYWNLWTKAIADLRQCQEVANALSAKIAAGVQARKSSAQQS